MSTSWGERPDGMRRGTNPESLTVPYKLTTSANTSPTIARALALGYSPVIYGGLYRQKAVVTDIGSGAVWDVEITYGPLGKKEPEDGDFKWSFSTTGGTKHITQARQHVQSYVSEGTPVDHKGAIGVTEDGNVAGVDVADRAYKWNETWQLLLASYGFTYSDVLGAMTGLTNNASFRGKATGTVLFAGAEGGQSIKEPTLLEVTFHFEYSPNATSLSAGNISGITKNGWDYLWVEYETADGGEGKRLAHKPKQANVERVLDSGDFSIFGIGTASL